MYLPDSIEQYKCSGYADDTTIAVTTDESIEEVFTIYDTFEEASRAKLNRGKSKGMWLGAWKSRTDTPLSWVKELPLLGATFSVGITPSQPGKSLLPSLNPACPPGLVFRSRYRARRRSLMFWRSRRFGTCATSLQSRCGRQNVSKKLFGPFSGRAKNI